MSLHQDLLAQAHYLARREPRRPRQASLRRAVSSAYYAIFHMLTYEASTLFAKDDGLVALINRTYGHAQMNHVSKSFSKGILPKKFHPVLATLTVPDALKAVAQAFVDLQQARHEADYNLAKRFTRGESLALIARVDQAFRDWKSVRTDDIARIYLSCFLLWDDWDKVR